MEKVKTYIIKTSPLVDCHSAVHLTNTGQYFLELPEGLKEISKEDITGFMLNEKQNEGKILVTEIIEMTVHGVETHYCEKEWVENQFCEGGGYYKKVKKQYPEPMVNMDFIANVNTKLNLRDVLSDGINTYIAIEEYKIELINGHVNKFNIPKELFHIYAPFCG